MRVHFRTYCYGCRRGKNWHGKCIWRAHKYDWEYYIECDDRRLVQRQAFKTFDRAQASAQRSWFKLLAVECINEP